MKGGPRIDPKFVNNPDLSDIQFRVEGKIFYAHKGDQQHDPQGPPQL
jgi:ankyrin repeat/BTB/POZ domain-containing protein 2